MNARPLKEPLPSALGGFPLTLKVQIQDLLNQWRHHGLIPVFIFDGMDMGSSKPFDGPTTAARANLDAWALYNHSQANEAVIAFGESSIVVELLLSVACLLTTFLGAVQPSSLFRFLQLILDDNGVAFRVAPYKAWAQVGRIFGWLKIYILTYDSLCISKDLPENTSTHY